jgi:hypothetical protein
MAVIHAIERPKQHSSIALSQFWSTGLISISADKMENLLEGNEPFFFALF